MVGPGEVDDSLLAETAEECQRFGRVVECEVRETRNVAPEYAVQIFIKFSHKDEAFKGTSFFLCLHLFNPLVFSLYSFVLMIES